MAEILTLTAPIVPPSTTTYRVRLFFMDPNTPSIKTEFETNLGERIVWRYTVEDGTTLAQVNAALSYINKGRFKTINGVSLQKFLIQEAQSRGILGPGNVTGTED